MAKKKKTIAKNKDKNKNKSLPTGKSASSKKSAKASRSPADKRSRAKPADRAPGRARPMLVAVGEAGGGLSQGDRVALRVDILPGLAGQTGTVDSVFSDGQVQVELDAEFRGLLVGPAPQHKFKRLSPGLGLVEPRPFPPPGE
ncbi:MAG: hypothetical protein QOF78_649 [Phycisphaerales bacterium]|jgi:hypothetical protein|nr:hypothetical protein [Phycisphaerales bacterium]